MYLLSGSWDGKGVEDPALGNRLQRWVRRCQTIRLQGLPAAFLEAPIGHVRLSAFGSLRVALLRKCRITSGSTRSPRIFACGVIRAQETRVPRTAPPC